MPVKAQDFFPPTADTLVYYFNADFDVWEEAMKSNGFHPLDKGIVAPEDGPLYINGNPPDSYRSMSKDSDQISVQVIQSGVAGPVLGALFREITEEGRHVGSQETYVFSSVVKIDYYLYKGFWFGLNLSEGPGRTEETIYLIEPFM
ncbi:MAG: hypothetical protein LUE10_09420 [Alistipes sp.]|nr:hypothetical protein [Alistipes sp.]